MTHCYTEGEDFCNPCRLAVTLELPECDPPIVVEPIIRPRPPRACGVQNGRFFLTTPPALDRKRYVIEASVDMMTWKAVAFSTSPEGMPSMEAFETQAETRDQMLWVQTDLSKQGTYYRVREQSADQRP